MATFDARGLMTAYLQLRKVLLTELPLPVEIPELRGTFQRPNSVAAVVRARTVILDLPIEAHRLGLIDGLLLDWLTAATAARLYEGRGEAWYGDIADAALNRFDQKLLLILEAME